MKDIPADDISRAHARGFRDYLLSQGMAPKTVNLRLAGMVTAYNELKTEGIMDANPFCKVKAREPETRIEKNKARRPFKKSELLKVIDGSDACLIGAEVIALNSGGRASEVTNIKIDEFNEVDAILDYFNKKGKKDMNTPVLPEFIAFIKELLLHHPNPKDPGAYILWVYGGHPNRAQELGNDFGVVLESVGLRDPNSQPNTGSGRRRYALSFHSIRWVVNMACKLSNMPQTVVQEFIGHKDKQTSEGYDDVGMAEKRMELYKAAGKKKLLKQMICREEPYMNIKDIMQVTVYAMRKLRAMRKATSK